MFKILDRILKIKIVSIGWPHDQSNHVHHVFTTSGHQIMQDF